MVSESSGKTGRDVPQVGKMLVLDASYPQHVSKDCGRFLPWKLGKDAAGCSPSGCVYHAERCCSRPRHLEKMLMH